MNPFEFNDKELAAYKKVIDAIKAAKKIGLHFYGRQYSLTAYNKAAQTYINSNGGVKLIDRGVGQVPCEVDNVLDDSGADDYERYATREDKEKYEAK